REGVGEIAFAGKPGSYKGNTWHKSANRVLFTIVHCQRPDCSIVQSPLFISVQQRKCFSYLFQHFQSRSTACNFWHETRSTAWVA
ncbi:MAG: hypothetical protein ABWZ65_17825, partial [Pseudomonas mandelii]